MSSFSSRIKSISWLRYGLIYAQTFAIAAYLSPWSRVRSSFDNHTLISYIFSELMGDHPILAFFRISLLVCLSAAIVSLFLIVYATIRKRSSVIVIHASLLLNSVAITGPLLYINALIWPTGTFGDFWSTIDELGIGWYVALLSGAAAGILIMHGYHGVCKSIETGCSSGSCRGSGNTNIHYLLALGLAIALGFVAIYGFLDTWSSGSASSFWAEDPWTTSGFEISPLMYLIPAAIIISCALAAVALFIEKSKGSIFLLVGQNLMVASFTLTLFWGLSFGETNVSILDMYIRTELHFGWYVCVISQFVSLVFLSLCKSFHSAICTIKDPRSSGTTPR